MPVNQVPELLNYLSGLQDVSGKVLVVQAKLDDLVNLATGGSLTAGALLNDANVQGNPNFSHMTAAQINQVNTDLLAIRAVLTPARLQSLSHFLSKPSI